MLHALNDGRFKLIAYRRAGAYLAFELYDLVEDPAELRDVHRRFPEHVARLRHEMERKDVFVDHPPEGELDDAARERLRALGYLR
jgi:hypothetical protein